MSLAHFQFTDRARPIVEIGIGDTRIATSGGVWDTAHWDTAGDVWSGVEPDWLDITCDCFSYSCEYGRARTLDRFMAGSATVVVHNATGWADPNATEEPGQLTMRPGRSIRMGIVHQTLGTRWLFRGFVDAMDPTYDPVDMDTVSFSCIDALGEVNRAIVKPLATPDYAGDTINVRIGRLLDAASWPATKRSLSPAGDTLIASDMGGQLADLLGQAADSGGGSVFADLDANICFRARDWQTFVPGTPPDGTIGNVEMGHTIPGVPQVDGYLTPTVGTVTTPNPGPLPSQWVIVAHVRPTDLTGSPNNIAAYWRPGQWAWSWEIQGAMQWWQSTTGSNAAPTGLLPQSEVLKILANNADGWVGVAVSGSTLTPLKSQDGVAWQPAAAGVVGLPPINSTAVVDIGCRDGNPALAFHGRIYSIELRTGLNPAAGTVLWRLDANDYPGTGTTYTDPRGRTWTLSAAGAITPKVPAVPPIDVPADVCPVQWERPFNRADLATRVLIGRDADTAQVLDDLDGQLRYGIEPFDRTDLLTESDQRLAALGTRILRVRAADTAPRIRSVSLDTRTATNALDLAATVDIFKPSRYRCRLRYPRGDVFDAEHFATGVSHEVTPQAWTVNLNLDLAAPYAAAGGRWDSARWDQSTWVSEVTALRAEAEHLLADLEGIVS